MTMRHCLIGTRPLRGGVAGLHPRGLTLAALVAACMAAACWPASARAADSPPATQPVMDGVIRINAGADEPYMDPQGRLWLSDQGFVGGQIVDRAEIPIDGTEVPAIYRTEHYSMESFSWPVPNGRYILRLHFAETYQTAAGRRIFSVGVEGIETISDMDVFSEVGQRRALIRTILAEVRDGRLDLTFTASVDNAEINGIEIERAPVSQPAADQR